MAEGKATIVIQFDGGADASLLAAAFLDDELNRDESGEIRTTFAPDDQPWFLVHLDPGLAISRIRCSSGSVRIFGEATRMATADVDADNEGDVFELDRIPAGEPSGEWFGNAPAWTRAGRQITWRGDLPATGALRWPYRAVSCRYFPPREAAGREWRARVVVHVEASK